jgi:hypothetical protein
LVHVVGTVRTMNASTPSRRGLWLAFGGLAIVPIAGVMLVLTMTDDHPKRRAHSAPTPEHAASPAPAQAPEPLMNARDRPTAQPAPAVALDDPTRQPPDLSGAAAAEQEEEEASDPADEVNTLLEESRRVENTDPARSRQILRDILAQDPDNIVALERLSTKLLLDENHAEAKKLAEHCRELGGPQDCDQVASQAVENNSDVERLAGAVKGCLANTPENIGCLSGMVNYHLIKGEFSDAAVYAGRLTQEDPQAPETLYARARIKASGKDYGNARQLFQWSCDKGFQDACYRQHLLEAEGW